MGCKCKEVYYNAKQYSEETNEEEKQTNLLSKIGGIFVRFVFGIFCIALIIIIAIPFLIFFLIKTMLGKDINIDISKIIEKTKRNKNNK